MLKRFAGGFLVILVGFCLSCQHLPAQSSYGSIVGTVTDSSGAIIPNAPVTLTNIGTSQQLKTTSNGSGDYRFGSLQPGTYKIDVEMQGFKHLTGNQVEVQVSVVTRIDAVMQVGDVSQQVEVTDVAPLVDTEDATVGQVVEGRSVIEMPLNGRNVMNLIELAPGVVPHGQSQGQTARSGNSNYQISGGMPVEGKTLVDGVPWNLGLFNGQSGVPIQDTVQEFQVMANNVPPEFGGTLDGIVTIATKSGTNEFHGAGYEFLRNKVLNANTWFANHAGQKRGAFTQNQFGLNGGGPIIHNKSFIYLAWEEFDQSVGASTTFTVPTVAERAGDFSNLRTASGALIPIYDPATTCGQINYLTQTLNPTCVPGQPIRTQFPNNMIPSDRFDATATIMEKYWPLPNTPGSPNTSVGNFFENASSPNNRGNEQLRFDQVISSKDRMFGTYQRYNTITPLFDYYGLGIGYVEDQGNEGGMVANTYTFNSNTLFDVRLGYNHGVFIRIPNTAGVNLTSIGWPSSYNSQYVETALPVAEPNGFSNSDGAQTSTASSSTVNNQGGGAAFTSASLSKVVGRHSLKLGGEFSWLPTAYGAGAGSTFAFTTNFTAINPNATAGTGSSFASYLLGLGSTGTTGNSLFPMMNMHIAAAYVGDVFQLNNHLTLNYGVRWQYPGYWSERHDRMGVFLPKAVNPVLSAAGLNNPGDVALVDSARYSNTTDQLPHWHLFAPRVGVAYRLNDKTVIRSGYGIDFTPGPFQEYTMAFEQPFTSASTAWVPTHDNGLTPVATLNNPFASGINQAPGRNSSYESTILGQNLIIPTPQNATPYIQNWDVSFERQLGSSSAISVTYVGTHALHLTEEGDGTPPGGPDINQIPDSDDSRTDLLTQVQNPYYGLIKTGSLATAMIPQGQLLRPYPQFGTIYNPGITELDAHYNGLQAKFQQRLGAGSTLLVSYTLSKNYGNADTIQSHTEPIRAGTIQDYNNWSTDSSLISFDVRNLLVISYVMNLPFGRGQRFLGATNPFVNHVVSGWGVDGITTLQSGFPLPLTAEPTAVSTNFGAGTPRPNVAAGCHETVSGSQQSRITKWFNTSSTCFTQPIATEPFGNEPRVDPNIRWSGIANHDFAVFRNVKIAEKIDFQFRAEFFNIFNRTQFGPPGNEAGTAAFGVVSSQYNNPRLIQFAARLSF